MAKPQPLPDKLPTDIKQVKDLLDSRFVGLKAEQEIVQQGRENIDEYNRQISKLRRHSESVLGFDDYKPEIQPKPKREEHPAPTA